MRLCQEFGGFPNSGGLREQDAYIMECWKIMLNEEAKIMRARSKKK